MKLYEYQAKELFAEAGIKIPRSYLIDQENQADEAAKDIGYPHVIKAQVLSGGRGKAGLISFAKNNEESKHHINRIFNHKTKPKQIMIEQAIQIKQEIYLAITVDPVDAKALLIASSKGGVDIEEIAMFHGDQIIKTPIDMRYGLMGYQVSHVVHEMGLEGEVAKQMMQIMFKLYDVFKKYDCELAEINPLLLDDQNQLYAADGKVVIDDNALFRQTKFKQTIDDYQTKAEYEAIKSGIPFIQFEGDIGLMCAGAGLTTTVYDLIIDEGGTVANYLEFGGPNYKKAMQAMEICLMVPSKVILIVTFGTIARADVMAEGIVDAIKRLKPDRPIITCIRGTNEIEATRLLKEAGLTPLFDTEEAVKFAVSIAKGD